MGIVSDKACVRVGRRSTAASMRAPHNALREQTNEIDTDFTERIPRSEFPSTQCISHREASIVDTGAIWRRAGRAATHDSIVNSDKCSAKFSVDSPVYREPRDVNSCAYTAARRSVCLSVAAYLFEQR